MMSGAPGCRQVGGSPATIVEARGIASKARKFLMPLRPFMDNDGSLLTPKFPADANT